MGASSDAVEAMTKILGPSEMDPYAVIWEEQPMNILKGFIVYFPDMEGFDKSAEDVQNWTKEQAVAECVRIQQFCPKAIDKPWAVTVQEALGDEAAEAGFVGLKRPMSQSWQPKGGLRDPLIGCHLCPGRPVGPRRSPTL